MSVLKPGVESFLGRFLQSSLDKNWRTPTDFIRHFGPTELIAALADAPEVRSHLLVEAAGVHARIATKKSPESATEDLQIALDEGVATPEMIVALFPADDQARFLPRAKAWSYLTEQPFWSDGRADSVSRVTFVVTTAVEEGLLTLEQVLQSLNLDALVDVLPPPELRAIMRYSLDLGRQGKSVTELGLLELLSMEKLFGFSSVARLWQDLIVELVATPCALNGASGAGRGPEPTSPADRAKKGRSEGSATQSEKAASAKPEGAAALSAEAKGAPATAKGAPATAKGAPATAKGAPATAKGAPATDADFRAASPSFDDLFEEIGAEDEFHEQKGSTETSEAEQALESPPPSGDISRGEAAGTEPEAAPRSALEVQSRERATERLRSLERLPPSWDSLPTPVLLSVDSMYAELVVAADDEAREEIIRDSFPNEALLRTALLAVIELLDPTINTNDAIIAEADVDSLIKLVVFEERLRFEQAGVGRSGTPSRRVSAPPPLPSTPPQGDAASRRSAPPPLPRPGTLGSASALKKAR